ncbi:beta-lactamase/transpeptidase-like protein [Thozetella sp. PMI_491]|nr:beta-lactamase/transpeptidase-like protein [Thozetella sp. PMI_491]
MFRTSVHRAYSRLRAIALLALVSNAAHSAATSLDCGLFGPDFPPPQVLADDPAIAKATSNLELQFADVASPFVPDDTAYSVAFFSTKSNEPLWEYHYSPPIPLGVDKVDGDSIYRIGSISKVFTVWTMLVELGDKYFNEPIVQYVPGLESLTTAPKVEGFLYDDIETIKWDEITIGNLASHAAGLPRDGKSKMMIHKYGTYKVVAIGLPPLDESELLDCPFTRPCEKEDFDEHIGRMSSSFPSAHSPAYSNIAFFLLAEALKNITGKDISTAMEQSIFEPLGMTHSTYTIPKTTDFGVIPGGNETLAGWTLDIGIDNAAGSLFSSTNDLIRAANSIMTSSLMPPAVTRRWFNFRTQTAYPSAQVGAPWEISNIEDKSTGRLLTVHTKAGDVGKYHAELVLSRAHDVGYVVLIAGNSELRNKLTNVVGETLLPALEVVSRRQAEAYYTGTYVDTTTNSSVVIQVDDDRMGLQAVNWTTNGIRTIEALKTTLKADLFSEPRLYPSTLKSLCARNDGDSYVCRTGWRAVIITPTEVETVMDTCLFAWANVGGQTYGDRGLDDWVFELGEDGKATALEIRVARVTLKRTSDGVASESADEGFQLSEEL